MKQLKFYGAMGILCATAPLLSCVNEKGDTPCPPSDQIIHLYVKGVETRTATGDLNKTNIHSSVSVGAFAVAAANSTITNGVNNEYASNGSGKLTAKEEKEIIVKEGTENLKIHAYAPYNPSWTTHNQAYDFYVATDQSNETDYLRSDLLYAESTPISKVAHNQGAVGLKFDHMMSRVKLTIDVQTESINLSAAKVIVNNTNTKTTFNPATGVLTTPSEIEIKDITAITTLELNTEVYAIIVPQTVEAGKTLFTIENSGKTYTIAIPESVTFESGKTHAFTATFSPTDVKITIDGPTESQVTDWIDSDEGKVDPDEKTSSDENGSQEEEEKIVEKYIDLPTNNVGSGVNTVWYSNVKMFSWWKDSPDVTLIPTSTDLTTEEYKSFKSLVVSVSGCNTSPSDFQKSGIVLKTGKGIFKSSNSEDMIISEDDTYVIDLTQFGNQDLLDATSGLSVAGNNPDTRSSANNISYYVTIDEIYFTTQKASSVEKEISKEI